MVLPEGRRRKKRYNESVLLKIRKMRKLEEEKEKGRGERGITKEK